MRRSRHSARPEQDACHLIDALAPCQAVRGVRRGLNGLWMLTPLSQPFTIQAIYTSRDIELMATSLRGFYKDPNPKSTPKKSKGKWYPVKSDKKPKKDKKSNSSYNWNQNPKFKAKPDNDRFYLSRAWRELRYLVLKNCDGRCMCCGASAKDGVRIHVDHIVPRSRGGAELDINNCQVLCEDCNIGKSNLDDRDWRPIID